MTLVGLAMSWLYCSGSVGPPGLRTPGAAGESGYNGMLWGLSEGDVSILERAPQWGGSEALGRSDARSYAVELAGYPGILSYRFGADGLTQIVHMTEAVDPAELGERWDEPFITAALRVRSAHGFADYTNVEWLEDPKKALLRGGLREAVLAGDSALVAKWELPHSEIVVQMNGDGAALVLMVLYSRK